KKGFLEKMFGKMMPGGGDGMGIWKMNFGGMGGKMMKDVMKKENGMRLGELIEMGKEEKGRKGKLKGVIYEDGGGGELVWKMRAAVVVY
ncbi:DsrE/DsrF/DrsH-like family protein, partial [Bacillus pumilus]|uniref:DsrE/DsrF/DrsH-like family protein n=1 Tax=Bacillus pumilus TaxID=1408 RepID=UPI0016432C24